MRMLIGLIAAVAFPLMGLADGIVFFKGTFEEALAKAGAENKLVFVDVMTKWCGPCKAMDANVFPRKDVGDFYNQHFVAFKLDAEDASMDGPKIAEKYRADSFPTYLYIQPDGVLKHTSGGSMSADLFLAVGKRALGMNLGGEFEALEKKYAAGDRSAALVRAYIRSGLEYSELKEWSSEKDERDHAARITKAAREYFESRKPRDLVNADDFALLANESLQWDLKITRGHPAVEYLIAHYDEAARKLPAKDLAEFMTNVNYYGIQEAAGAGKKDLYLQYVNDINGVLKPAYASSKTDKFDPVEVLRAMGDTEYAFAMKDYDQFLKRGWELVQLADSWNDAATLLQYARRLEHVEGGAGEKYLPETLKFIQKAYDEDHNIYVAADYGRILAKTGDKERAGVYYAEVMRLADEMGGERGKEIRERFTKEMKELGLDAPAPGSAQTRDQIAAELLQAAAGLSRRSQGEGESAAASGEASERATVERRNLERAVQLFRERPDDQPATAGLSYVLYYCRRGPGEVRAGCEKALPEARAVILKHWLDKEEAASMLMGSNDPELMDAAFEKRGKGYLTVAELAAPYWVGKFQDPQSSEAERQRAYDMVMKYANAMAADDSAIDIDGKKGVKITRWKGEGLINTVNNMLPGKPMPDFGFTDLDRKPVTLADYKGKVVLLDFWATWCKPCVASMPAIKAFRAELLAQGKPFEVISVDNGDTPEKVRDFQKKSVDMPWVQWHQESFTREYFNIGLQSLPTYILVDANGRILFQGTHFDEALRQRIRAAVG